ncbi:MAG: alpha/beta hydrolase [Planctomycetes bacterium]|nr:alpha/beta hydrolase [Planctomycetota bacterium]
MRMRPIRLVLLPGMDGTGILFRPLLEALPSELLPVVVSYPPDQALGYSELLPLVEAALPKGEPFLLLAESFSGPLAIRAAARRPAGLCGLVLSASFAKSPFRRLPSLVIRLLCGLILRAGPKALASPFLLGFDPPPALKALLLEALSTPSTAVLSLRLRELLAVDATAELRGCPVPILCLAAARDRVLPGSAYAHVLDAFPAAKSVTLDGPHLLLQRAPRAAAEAVRAFAGEAACACDEATPEDSRRL